MPYKRALIAAAALLGAVYLKFTLPSFSETFMPALRQTLAEEQAAVYVPEEWLSWLRWS